jgi:hypothetical protein
VLVGAASAGGYTLLQDGKKPPPPATTVAAAPPAATTPEALPPATQEPLPTTPSPSRLPPLPTPAPDTNTPALDTSSPPPPPPPGDSGTGGGAVDPADDPVRTTPAEPQLALTDIALGAAAVVYAPYTPDTVDLGDASRTVDGSTKTAWHAPEAADPSASPQIGVYVDLASKETIAKLAVQTPTPGMDIEIYGAVKGPPAAITDPGWAHLANRADIAAETAVKLPAQPYRYVLVWITGAPPDGASPAISELSLLSLQPE